MLRSLSTTPRGNRGFLKRELKTLDEKTVMERYGTFFLHELQFNENNPLPKISKEDCREVLNHLKVDNTLQSKIFGQRQSEARIGERKEFRKSPHSVEHLEKLLAGPPSIVFKTDEIKAENLDGVCLEAQEAFCELTDNLFFALSTHHTHVSVPSVDNCLIAIQRWGASSIRAWIPSALFLANSHDMHRINSRAPQETEFVVTIINTFFPEQAVAYKDGIFQILAECGYLHRYNEKTVEIKDRIREDMRKILNLIDCFPRFDSGNEKGPGHVWQTGHQENKTAVPFLTNAARYSVTVPGILSRVDPPQKSVVHRAQVTRNTLRKKLEQANLCLETGDDCIKYDGLGGKPNWRAQRKNQTRTLHQSNDDREPRTGRQNTTERGAQSEPSSDNNARDMTVRQSDNISTCNNYKCTTSMAQIHDSNQMIDGMSHDDERKKLRLYDTDDKETLITTLSESQSAGELHSSGEWGRRPPREIQQKKRKRRAPRTNNKRVPPNRETSLQGTANKYFSSSEEDVLATLRNETDDEA